MLLWVVVVGHASLHFHCLLLEEKKQVIRNTCKAFLEMVVLQCHLVIR